MDNYAAQPGPPQDMVPGEQYRYALSNFRIAHEQVEKQRLQMLEQERQVAGLRARIAALEGGGSGQPKPGMPQSSRGGSSVDDFTIKTAATRLERLINRWASDVTRAPPASLNELREAALWDVMDGVDLPQDPTPASAMEVQNLLRHALSKAISEGVVNCLIVTDSSEANVQLTRIHEHIFARDATVACVWRRQTFTAAIDSPSAETSTAILSDFMPGVSKLLQPSAQPGSSPLHAVVRAAYDFSRMLHGTPGGSDAFYRAFVPERAAPLDPHQVELVRRCVRSERAEGERVGATVFPGLVKIDGSKPGMNQVTVRRAQVICECAMVAPPSNVVSPAPTPVLNGV